MSKSISKKILLFLLVTVVSLCFAIYNLSLDFAKADEGENKFIVSDTTVDGDTDESSIQARIDEIIEGIEYYQNLLPSNVVLDADNDILDDLKIAINDSISYNQFDLVSGYLFGNYGLNGLLGMYETAYKFYSEYVVVDSESGLTAKGAENGFVLSVDAILVADATEYLLNFKAKSSELSTKVENPSYLDAWITAFDADEESGLAYAEAKQTEIETACEQVEKQLDYLNTYYFSDKFGSEYTNKAVYGSDEDVSEAKLNEVKAEVERIFNDEVNFEKALADIDAELAEYNELFAEVKTALARAYESISASANLNSESAKATDVLLAECEDAFKSFEALGTIAGYVKGTDGKLQEVEIDLKSGNIVGQENDSLGDLKVALNLMSEYKSLVKRAIAEAESVLEESYGVSAEKFTNDYVNYAKGLADCLTGYFGKLTPAGEDAPTHSTGYKANQYSYVNASGNTVDVVYGSDIVTAFKDSPFCDGALVIIENGSVTASSALDGYRLKSSVSGEVKDGEKTLYVITLTCIDDQGNEINYFNSDAELFVRDGATPSIERNLYLILKKDSDRIEDATAGLKEDGIVEYLSGRVLSNYFTFIIKSSVIKDGKKTVLEFDSPITVQIKIEFKDAEEFNSVKGKTCALSYNHTKINAVYSDIDKDGDDTTLSDRDIVWGDSTMTLKISNFVNQAQIALALTAETPMDYVKIAALCFAGLIGGMFLVWFLIGFIKVAVAIIKKRRAKGRKYKILFNARGGRFNSCLKVRLHEKFNHPAPPVRKGYKFLGWFEDSKCTVRFASSELTKKGNLKVYAKWISEEEYEKLEDKLEVVLGATGAGPIFIEAPAPTTVKKESTIDKLEVEKLSYEAKKAEEERKTEEVKLQAIREIDEAKKNDEARAKAEQEASEAKAELEKSLAEREKLITKERADERAKCIEEMQSSAGVSEADYQDAIAKAKAETEEKLRKEFDEESKARAEEQAKINAELAEKIKALEEANAKAEAEAKKLAEEEAERIAKNEERINAAIAAGLAAKLAEMEANKPVVEAPVVEETAPAFDTARTFDELKAEIYSYADADDLDYALEASVPACAMKVVGDAIELEVNLDLEDLAKKGYKVANGDKLASKFVVASEDDIDEAEELIEEAMLVNGLKKASKAVVTESTAETRENGFDYGVAKARVAETPEEFYKLIRVFTKSFVLADDGDVEEKALVKMFLSRGKVYLYINHEAEGLNACDSVMAALGFKSFMTVKNVDDCKEAIARISAMMKANGLVRFPSEVKVAEEDSTKGFTYTLSK